MSRATWEGDVMLSGACARGLVVVEGDGRIGVWLVMGAEHVEPSTADAITIAAEALRCSVRRASHVANMARATGQGVQRGGDVAVAFETLRRAALEGPRLTPIGGWQPGDPEPGPMR